jgi:hypothetical protein
LAGLEIIRGRLPFALLGLDTDNGTEFINELVHAYCGKDKIEFTRCRPYKKNDQAHVEQKNGSVIRRLVGYDRYDGSEAYDALRDLYSVLRLHLNHFQPSLKLTSKERDDGHVTKKYEVARTPVQRLLVGDVLSDQQKEQLRSQFLAMDPVDLLCRLRTAQDRFWALAWTGAIAAEHAPCPDYARNYRKTPRPKTKPDQEQVDCFTPIWHEVEALLQHDQSISVSQVFRSLQSKYPGHFQNRHIALLRRKVRCWCREHPAAFIAAPVELENESLQLPRRRYNGSGILTVLKEEIEHARRNDPTLSVKALFEQLQRLHPGSLNSQQIHMFRRRLHEWRREASGEDTTTRAPADAGARWTPKQSDSQTQ